jgi:hypothetical protein
LLNEGLALVSLTGKLPVKTVDVQPRPGQGEFFWPEDWAPNGKYIAGFIQKADGSVDPGLYLYILDTKKYEKIADLNSPWFEFGPSCSWLSDSKRLLFTKENKVYLTDIESRKYRPVFQAPPGTGLGEISVSQDDQTIYFIHTSSESDIWMATLQ